MSTIKSCVDEHAPADFTAKEKAALIIKLEKAQITAVKKDFTEKDSRIKAVLEVIAELKSERAAIWKDINVELMKVGKGVARNNNPSSNKASVTEQTVAANILPVDETQTAEQSTSETQDTAPVIPLAQEITTSEPGVDTTNLKSEDYPWINLVRAFMQAKVTKGINLLQTVANLFQNLKKMVADKHASILAVFSENAPLDVDAQLLLDSMATFGDKFVKTLNESVFKPKTEKGMAFRYAEDAAQYLAVDGKIPENVAGALAAVGYKWLSTRSSESLFNDKRAIQAILGLKKEDKLNAQAYQLLREIGVTQNMLSEQLGKEAFKLLGIELKPDSPADLQQRLEKALGLMLIANLEHLGLVKQNRVFTGSYSKEFNALTREKQLKSMGFIDLNTVGEKEDSAKEIERKKEEAAKFNKNLEDRLDAHQEGKFGIAGLKNNISKKFDPTVDHNSLDVEGTWEARHTQINHGKTVSVFYQVTPQTKRDAKGNLKALDRIQQYKDLWRNSKHTWERVFTGTVDETEYTWKKVKRAPGWRAKIQKTNQYATEEQTKNVQNNSDKAWVASTNTMNMFLLLDRQSQLEVMGYTDPATIHISERENVIDANKGLERNLDHMLDWLANADRQPKGRESEFYIQAKIARNLRMHQVGAINPQGSKLHRYVFGMKEWQHTFTLDDTVTEKRFMEAVGLSIGVEAGKKGGIKGALKATKDKLKEPEIAAAIDAIQGALSLMTEPAYAGDAGLLKIAEAHPGMKEAILAGVKAAGENVHSLKGLIEYARFLDAKQEFAKAKRRKGYTGEVPSFTTDIATEIDGMTNGPTLGRIQMMMSISSQNISTLRNAGVSFTNDQGDVGSHLSAKYNMDSYEAPGMAWSEALTAIEKELLDEFTVAGKTNTQRALELKQELSRLQAAKRLFGDFNDENGYAAKLIRKLAKNPVMTTMYGSGTAALVNGLTETLITDSIYGRLEKIAANINYRNNKPYSSEATRQEDLGFLRDDVQILANISGKTDNKFKFYVTKDVLDKDGNLIPEQVLNLVVPDVSIKAIHESVEAHHGKALDAGIKAIYGDIIEARKPFNTGFAIVTALYNVARAREIKLAKDKQVNKAFDLSVKEYAAIDEKLKGIFPTMATAFEGGRMDMTKDDPVRDYSTTQMSSPSFKPLPGHKQGHGKTSYLANRAQLKSPGVAPFVGGIQSLDATISNRTQGMDLGILNVHDGFFTGIGQAPDVNVALNKQMFDLMKEFDMLDEMQKAIGEARKQFADYAKGTDLSEEISAEFKRLGIAKDGKYRKAISKNIAEMQSNAAIATANKQELLAAIDNFNNYYYPEGGYRTNNVQSDSLGDVDLKQLDAQDKADVDARAAKIKVEQPAQKEEYTALIAEYVDKVLKPSESLGPAATTLRSAPNTSVSNNPADYAIQLEVDQGNAVSTYETIKNDSNIQDSATHDARLKRILHDIVAKVIEPANLFLTTQTTQETAGRIDTVQGGKDTVFISSLTGTPSGVLAQGIRMSTGEVYVHELVHAVTQYGLKMNKHLRDQVQAMYDLAKSQLDYTSFLEDPATATQFEIDAAKDRFDYIFNKPAVAKVTRVDTATGMAHTDEFSKHLDEFMSFGLTNENFSKALGGIAVDKQKLPVWKKSSWAGIIGDNTQETLVNLLDRIISMFLYSFNMNQPAPDVARELERLAVKLSHINGKNKSMAADLMQKSDAQTNKITEYANKKIKGIFVKYPRLSLIQHGKTFTQLMANRNSPSGQVLRDIRAQFDGMHFGFGQAIAREINGLTDRLEPLHKLINMKGQIIDRAREEAVANMVGELGKLWSRELTKEEKVSLTKILIKTDVGVLRKYFTLDQITEMVGDPGKVEAAIGKLKAALNQDKELRSYVNYYIKQAESLGFFLVHGKALNESTYTNAHVIGHLKNTAYERKLAPGAGVRAEALVDQLASLYALNFTHTVDRQRIHTLMVEDPAAVEGVLELHSELKRQSQETLFFDNPNKIMKGYTKEITNQRIMLAEAPASEESALLAQGYIKTSRPIPRDPRDQGEENYLYVARHGVVNSFRSTIASLTGNRKKGTSFQHISNAGTAAAAVMAAKQRAVNALFQGRHIPFNRNQPLPNYLVPSVDDHGKVTDYRYVMSEETKNSLLEKHNDYDSILGAMAGQIVDKPNTKIINSKLINALKDLYDTEYALRSNMYVEISPYSLDERYRNIYNSLPAAAREEIKTVWGDRRMFVAKDVVDLAFGFRKYSIVDAFGKTPADRAFIEKVIVSFAQKFLGPRYMEFTRNIEEVLSDITKLAKNNIVVRSLSVTLNNFFSNLVFLKMNGVNNVEILKYWREASVGVVRYQKEKKALDAAELKLKVSEGRKPTATLNQATIDATSAQLRTRIREMKNEIALNPVTQLVDAGLLQSIVDDIETSKVQSPYPGLMDNYADKLIDALPGPVAAAGKVAFLAQDTQAYKVLNNAVKMTDFIGRYIMYKYYTVSLPAAQRMPHDKAIAKVMHQFVNFNLPSHKLMEWGNQVGLLWFTKYALGILKPIAQVVTEKPAESILAFASAQSMGVSNIFESGLNDPTRVFGNPLDVLVGSAEYSTWVDNAVNTVR